MRMSKRNQESEQVSKALQKGDGEHENKLFIMTLRVLNVGSTLDMQNKWISWNGHWMGSTASRPDYFCCLVHRKGLK